MFGRAAPDEPTGKYLPYRAAGWGFVGCALAILLWLVAAGASFRRAGSGALGLAYVADGRQDGYCELHINSWDALAGILLVREAGGAVNDFLANDGLAQGNPVLAASPGIREALSQATGIAA